MTLAVDQQTLERAHLALRPLNLTVRLGRRKAENLDRFARGMDGAIKRGLTPPPENLDGLITFSGRIGTLFAEKANNTGRRLRARN